jgi:hypothetical protein
VDVNTLIANENVINRNVDQLDKEADESHNQESSGSSFCNGREFLTIRLGTLLDQVYGVLGKLPERLYEHFIESLFFSRRHVLIRGG